MFVPCCKDFELWLTNHEVQSSRVWHDDDCQYIASGEMPMVRLAVSKGDVDYELRVETFGGNAVVYLCDYAFRNILSIGRFAEYGEAMVMAHDYTTMLTRQGFTITNKTDLPIY